MQKLSAALGVDSPGCAACQGGSELAPHKTIPLFLAWLLLGCIGLWLLSVGYNPSHGAQGDFENYHLVTVQQYVELPWRSFLQEMRTASGPLFYAVLGALHLDRAELARPAVLLMHLGSTGLLGVLAQRIRLGVRLSLVLMGAFFFSPFQLGPALWGHPETLATLMMMAAMVLHVAVRDARGSGPHGGWLLLLPLAVAVRQTSLAIVAAQMLEDLQQRRYRATLVQGSVSVALLVVLAMAWGSLTPPTFQDHLQPSLRTGLVALALLVPALMAGSVRGDLRPDLGVLGRRWLLMMPLTMAMYVLSAPFERGGFIFSRLDMLGFSWLSPAVITPVLAWCWGAMRANPLLSVQILGGCLVLAASNVFYVKYVDFYFWPLLCMALVRTDAPGRQALVYSAMCWTAVHLLLVTIVYRA
ncbi:MAG: hypothetical protein RLZ81_999 [Pseudomonadota bacterium]|jgi:hypothetical protein